MVISGFKFSNPKLMKLHFQMNPNYMKMEGVGVEVGLTVSHYAHKISDNEATVELDIEGGEQSDAVPFFINLVIGARFKLDADVEGTDFDKLLKVNAPSLLLSYARPIIANLSNQAGMKPIHVPFINFANQQE